MVAGVFEHENAQDIVWPRGNTAFGDKDRY